MGKNELSEAGTSMVRDNMANFRRDTRKTRVTGYPGGKAWVGGGGMRANTETSRSSARARAATTMSIFFISSIDTVVSSVIKSIR